MAPAAQALTADLEEDVVDFVPNYDNQFMQPSVLPAAFPNLLVNGTTGIAVGMATNMAPHNLREVIAGTRHLIAHPEASLKDIMKFIPGPDLPTGGTIVGLGGIRDAYETYSRYLQDPREGLHRAGQPPQAGHRRHRTAVHGLPRKGHRKDQGRRQLQEAHRYLRRGRPDRPYQRSASRHRN